MASFSCIVAALSLFNLAPDSSWWIWSVGRSASSRARSILGRRIAAWAWSPSGRQIAVAGTIGPATTIWFGDRDAGRLEPIAHPPLRTSQPEIVWASEDELILSTLPDEAIGTMVQAEDLASRQWAKTNQGLEPSRSILETGVNRAAAPDGWARGCS